MLRGFPLLVEASCNEWGRCARTHIVGGCLVSRCVLGWLVGVRGALVGLALVVCAKVGRGRSKCSVRTLAGVCKLCSWVAPGPLVGCAAHFASSVIVGDPSWELARASG